MSKRYKKLTFSIFLITLITLGINVYAGSNLGYYFAFQFSDTSNHWAKDVISKYTYKGFVKGMGDGTFRPDEKITRAQFLRILHSGMGIDNKYFAKPDITKIFKDVKNEDWYAMTLYDLYTDGIIDAKDYIRANEFITREEIAHYLINAYRKSNMGINDLMPIIKDKDKISNKYLNDVYYSYNAKILSGKLGGIFDPKGYSTRAEGLVAVNNLLKAIGYDNMSPVVIEPSYSYNSDDLQMKLTVKNMGSKPLYIQHTSSNKYDFELLDSKKESIYRWSADKSFLQAIEFTNIEKKSEITFSEKLSKLGNEGIFDRAKYLAVYINGRVENEDIKTMFILELNNSPAKMPNINGNQEPEFNDEIPPQQMPDINGKKEPIIREENKKIEVKVEGQSEMREAKLTFSQELGYSFYLLDNFKYSPEEPGKDIIFSKYDGDFFVRIEKLDAKSDVTLIKEIIKKAYSNMGTVTDNNPKTLFLDKFKDSKVYIHVSIPKSKFVKTQTSVNYIVKEFGGDLYAFTFHFPLKEAAEGITPSIWAMVSTILKIKGD